MNKTFKFFNDKMGGAEVTQHVGVAGEVFYDPNNGFLRLSDGATPGGILLNMIGRQGYCLTAYDTTVQANSAAVNLVKYNTPVISDGISIVDLTKITFAHAGRYNIQFSLQMDKLDSGTDEFELWLVKNGVNVPFSNTKITSVGNNDKFVASWNFVEGVLVGDYLELAWHSIDTEMRIFYNAEATNPARPAIPSAILTVTQV